MTIATTNRELISAALAALRVERFVLGVHDASFPGQAGEDIGRGSPYSMGGQGFFEFAADLGFTGVQLGPQGRTSPINASPYDGTLFAKSPLSIALGPLACDDRWQGLLSQASLFTVAKARPSGAEYRVHQDYVWPTQEWALRSAYTAFAQRRAHFNGMAKEVLDFIQKQYSWLENDSLFEVLARRYGTLDWERWPKGGAMIPDARLDAESSEYAAFCQYLVHTQHTFLRESLAGLGLKLYGDLQVGVSHRDLWRHQALFLRQYRMGAPPSRTNPLGQPWGYPVLDPTSYGLGKAAAARLDYPGLEFVKSRLEKLFNEFDGLRIDHPHGLVCPWVYRADDPDPLHAVLQGARLFASPDLPDHPDLAQFSLVAPSDLARDRELLRYEDDWVAHLTEAQVKKHSVLFDLLVDTIRARGGHVGDIACEVLSTCPSPLNAVLARHGLGRFRVTQKADPTNVRDPYRSANATAADWLMLGTHDTPPIWRIFDEWQGTRRQSEWARYLADRLQPKVAARSALAARLANDPIQFRRALLADLFVGPAQNVSVFFTDLLGMKEIYNRPGEIDPQNWTLRIPPDYASLYRTRCVTGEAFELPSILALALRATSLHESPHAALIARLEEASLAAKVSLG